MSTPLPAHAPAKGAPWWNSEWSAMYTRVVLRVQGDSLQAAHMHDRLDTLYTLQKKTLQWGSQLDSALRKGKPGEVIPIDPRFIGLFRYAEQRHQETHGLFHPGIGDLLHAYGLVWGGNPHVPVGDTLIRLKHYLADSLFFATIPGKDAVRIRSTGHRFALGAVAEGWALDQAAHMLDSAGYQDFYVESGGDIQVRGHNPRGIPWSIGIQDPKDANGMLGVVHITPHTPHCFSTSGVYEKFFVDANGRKRSHILDPRTAESVQGMQAVTAFARSSLEADFWDTYLLLLPMDTAKAVVEREPDLEAILVSDTSLWVSPGLRGSWEPR